MKVQLSMLEFRVLVALFKRPKSKSGLADQLENCENSISTTVHRLMNKGLVDSFGDTRKFVRPGSFYRRYQANDAGQKHIRQTMSYFRSLMR